MHCISQSIISEIYHIYLPTLCILPSCRRLFIQQSEQFSNLIYIFTIAVQLIVSLYSMKGNSQNFNIENDTSEKKINSFQFVEKLSNINPANFQSCIILSSGMAILPTLFEKKQDKIHLKFSITRPNGSLYLFPSNYLTTFKQNIRSNENAEFTVHQFMECFRTDFVIKFNENAAQQQLAIQVVPQICKAIQQFRKFLYFLGFIKTRSLFALKVMKLIINLKKCISASIKLKDTAFEREAQQNQNNESNITKVQQISLKNNKSQTEDTNINRFIKRGGYFNVEKRECRLLKNDGSEVDQILALKVVRRSRSKQNLIQIHEQSKEKLEYQLRVIQKIKTNKYFLKYYKTSRDSFFGMQFVEKSLKDIAYGKNILQVKEIFSLCKQIILAVNEIHSFGVVHRDLKFDNILIQKRDQQVKVKIIDFGESVIIGDSDRIKKLGCTIPYSPIECAIEGPDGYDKKQIDLWSICMIIYELVFRERAIFYNRTIFQKILLGQAELSEYTPVLSHRPLPGIRKIQQFTTLLTEHNLRISQNERLSLSTLYKCIKGMEEYYDSSLKILQQIY